MERSVDGDGIGVEECRKWHVLGMKSNWRGKERERLKRGEERRREETRREG